MERPECVSKVDPETFAAEELIEPDDPAFRLLTAAIEVDGELWVSNGCGEPIA